MTRGRKKSIKLTCGSRHACVVVAHPLLTRGLISGKSGFVWDSGNRTTDGIRDVGLLLLS